MGFNFPDTPTVGQKFSTTAGLPTYTWDGEKWVAVSNVGPVYVAKAGDTMTGPLVLAADPAASLQAATKQYVDGKAGVSVASGISYTPAGNVASTNVQAAITEVDAEKVPLAGGTMTGTLTAPTITSSGNVVANAGVYTGNTTANGTVYFSNVPGSRYLTFDGSNFSLNGGQFFVGGSIHVATLYNNGYPTVTADSGWVYLYDAIGNIAQLLGNNTTYYRNGSHYFQNIGGGNTCSVAINGYVGCDYGYRTHGGVSQGAGGYGGNYFNIQYSGGNSYLYTDDVYMGVFAYQSDYRLKKDVVDLPGMWDTVRRLRPIKYTQAEFTPPVQLAASQKSGEPFVPADDIERWGFIAHELQETLLESASTSTKDAPDALQSPNPWPILAALTRALQEAMTRIEALEAKMA